MTERTLERALSCLVPVRERLVVIGGAAHRLFPQHELGQDPGFELLTTEDVDLAAPLELQHDGSRELLERLEKAGFVEEAGGADYAKHIYRLPEGGDGYLQFIAPLTGSGVRRTGRKDHGMRFSGIHAEKLRFVDLLFQDPWTLRTRLETEEVSLQVVNPMAFLLQKLLILRERGRKGPKDLLYIHDTLAVFGESLDELGHEAATLTSSLSGRATNKVRRTARDLCFLETDLSRGAADIAAGHRRNPPDSEQVVDVCRHGLRQVLGSAIDDL